MVCPDYLRTQAETCLRWARDCFDLATATRLRLMAEELTGKAAEIESSSLGALTREDSRHDRATWSGSGGFATGRKAS
jgi:hypothetical protein